MKSLTAKHKVKVLPTISMTIWDVATVRRKPSAYTPSKAVTRYVL